MKESAIKQRRKFHDTKKYLSLILSSGVHRMTFLRFRIILILVEERTIKVEFLKVGFVSSFLYLTVKRSSDEIFDFLSVLWSFL